MLRLGCITLALALLTQLALASDGVVEINQTCATRVGCFMNDSEGFPVFISEPGSYRLTSDLTLPTAADLDGIRVSGSNVTIDLNGFTINGPPAGFESGVEIGGNNVRSPDV